MKKEFFEEVQMEVLLLEIEDDIVTTSDINDVDASTGNEGDLGECPDC